MTQSPKPKPQQGTCGGDTGDEPRVDGSFPAHLTTPWKPLLGYHELLEIDGVVLK